jgi:hypothetical protein
MAGVHAREEECGVCAASMHAPICVARKVEDQRPDMVDGRVDDRGCGGGEDMATGRRQI